jgi:hypothetical protein
LPSTKKTRGSPSYTKDKHYTGKLRIAYSEYDDMDAAVIEEKIDIDNSPWWYEAVTDFAYDAKEEVGATGGEVWEFDIRVDVVEVVDDGEEEAWEDNELEKGEPGWEPYEIRTHEEIEITLVGKRRLVEAMQRRTP